MEKFKVDKLSYINKIKEMNFEGIKISKCSDKGYIRSIKYNNKNQEIIIEIYVDFRVRDKKKIYLLYTDLYIDKKYKRLSNYRTNKQVNIEKTYLSKIIEDTNNKLKNSIIENVEIKNYGDIYIKHQNNMVIEIMNDTHYEEDLLFKIIKIDNIKKEILEHSLKYIKGDLLLNNESISWENYFDNL